MYSRPPKLRLILFFVEIGDFNRDSFLHIYNIKIGRVVPGNLFWPRKNTLYLREIYKSAKYNK